MRFVDVNVLVYAHRPESPNHERYRSWLEDAMATSEPLGLADFVAAGFVRVVTHPKVFKDPSPAVVAFEFVRAVRSGPATMRVTPGERTWTIFEQVMLDSGATGNLVPDAFLAAVAIEQGATLVSADRSFARFPGLRWSHPLDA